MMFWKLNESAFLLEASPMTAAATVASTGAAKGVAMALERAGLSGAATERRWAGAKGPPWAPAMGAGSA